MKEDKELETSCERLAITTNRLKILVAEVLEDLEVSRRDFARALVKFSEMEEPLVFPGQMNFPNSSQFTSDSDEDIHLPQKPVPQSLRPSQVMNKPLFEQRTQKMQEGTMLRDINEGEDADTEEFFPADKSNQVAVVA